MREESHWTPRQVFELQEVLRTRALGGLSVGSSVDQVETLLGPAEQPKQRLGRKSKIWVTQYGNVSVLTDRQRIIAVNIDFEGWRPTMVRAGSMEKWRLDEWEAYSRQEGCRVYRDLDVLRLTSPSAIVSLRADGVLHVASLV